MMHAPMSRLSRRAFLWLATLFAPAARLIAAPVQATSLDDFVALSARLLERKSVDRDIAQVYLTALLADRDAVPVLAYLVEANNNPTPEMKALSATIIEWWYTGVYTMNGKERVATHTGALAWSALDMPAPGTCSGPFGAWSQPPKAL
jgi:hypothetical protein